MKKTLIVGTLGALATMAMGANLEETFRNPPHSAKPHTWYHIMNGNVTKQGITRDFEELAKIGMGGVQMFDAGCEIPPGGLDFNSPEWFDLLKHAASEADRLGLEICIPNCSGWSSSGGPWIKPSLAMKEVVLSEKKVNGGELKAKHQKVKLDRDRNDHGYYEDIACLAFPTPKAESVKFDDVKVEIGKDNRSFSFIGREPFSLAGFSFRLNYPYCWSAATSAKVEVSDDGRQFREIERFSVPLACSGSIDLSERFHGLPSTVKHRFVRVTLDDHWIKCTVKSARPEARLLISNVAAKTFKIRNEAKRDVSASSESQVIRKDSVVDVTKHLAADGTLDWQVPDGEWTIVRIGNKCNGRCNHPASDHGRGLEVDKLSASAMDFHFEQYVAKLVKHLGEHAGKSDSGFNNILVDSFEVGSQNWTQGLDKTFKERKGYSLTPYLAAFTGRVVGSVDETERFFEDFRRVVADLFAENYAGALTKKCHQYGLMCSIEPYGNCPADNLQYGECVDIPMGEFWSGAASGNFGVGSGNARFAAYIAHVWGRKFAGTESFTADPGGGGRWQTMPFTIKAQGDRVFANGVNRIIYHRFTHQPWADDRYLPGMTMGRWGMHFDRTQTWWDFGKGWIAYQTRAAALLQEGMFVADALYYCGSGAPNQGGNSDGNAGERMRLDAGYAWDICPKDAFMLIKVVDGKVVVPGGIGYRLLVMPSSDTIGLDELKKLDELISAGAKVSAFRRPTRAPGLVGYPNADGEVKRMVNAIWAKGVMEMNSTDAVKKLGIEPDFSARDVEVNVDNVGYMGIAYIHRQNAEADWYFVAMPNRKSRFVHLSFRQQGRVPEIWDAETGRVQDAAVWSEKDGRTEVEVALPVSGSAFVVFRRSSHGVPHWTKAEVVAKQFPANAKNGKATILEIVKAEYGVLGKQTMDLTDKVRKAIVDGRLEMTASNEFAGRDPVPMTPKRFRLVYRENGKENTLTVSESAMVSLPLSLAGSDPMLDYSFKNGKLMAAKPLSAKLTSSSGEVRNVEVKVPAPIAVDSPWQVSFPHKFMPNLLARQLKDSAEEKVEFKELTDWSVNDNEGIKFFSGTATYRTKFGLSGEIAKDAGLALDLGAVCEVARVTVNGVEYPPLWKPPFRVDITDVLRTGAKELDIKVEVANQWANRLIGDDRKCADDCEWRGSKTAKGIKEIGVKKIPDWVKQGKQSPTGRMTFTTWKHWDKDDELKPSGLLGPVMLRWEVEVK